MLLIKSFGFILIFSCLNYVQSSSFDNLKEFQQIISKNSLDLSEKCSEFYNYSNTSDPQFLSLLLKLIDSSAKIPTGLSDGNYFDIGNFDECYELTGELNSTTINGKYCLGTIPVPVPLSKNIERLNNIGPTPRMLGQDTSSMGPHFAYCVPSFCTTDDLQKIFAAIPILSLTKFQESYCYSKDSEPDLGTGGILTILVFAIFGALLLASTAYDIILCYTEKKAHHEVLLAFSALSNGRKLFKSTKNPEQLLSLNGIRAISMMWVIIGHEYSLMMNAPLNNYSSVLEFMTDKGSMWLLNAPLSVDTFFTVGGLVTMYTFLKASDKGVSFNIPMYYLHRYLRLTPSLAIMILVHANLLYHMGNGPLWGNVEAGFTNFCSENWWSALLYIQNYVNPSDTCVPQSWYLSVDMQLFVLSPLVLLPSKLWPKCKNIILGVLILLGMVAPFTISYLDYLYGIIGQGGTDASLKYMKYYYLQTYARFGPYIIGMLFGSIIYNYKKKGTELPKNSKNILISLVCWLLVLLGMVACIYGSANLLDQNFNRLSNSFVNGLNRSAWALGLCLIILLCITGFGGPVDKFLSLSIFQFLNKLSYTMYIVHYSLIGLRWSAQRSPVHFSHLTVMHIYWADFMVSLAISVLYCITFESPVIILEKYLFGGTGKSNKKPLQNEKSAQ